MPNVCRQKGRSVEKRRGDRKIDLLAGKIDLLIDETGCIPIPVSKMLIGIIDVIGL